MTIHELNDASSIIYEEAGDNANVILGCVIDKDLTDEVRVTVIATGLNRDGVVETDLRTFANTTDKIVQPKYKAENNDISLKQNKENLSKTQTNGQKTINNDEDDLISFGDEFDVPAFIRNRK